MAKGRRPLPSSVKALRGNPGKRKPNEHEPVPVSGDPEMPEGLSAAAQKKWHELLTALRPMRVLTVADGITLAVICYSYDVWMQCVKDLNENGPKINLPIMGRKGTPEENEIIAYKPAKNMSFSMANEAAKTMKSYMIEVGLTPASRSKLHVEKPQEEDPFESWAKQKAERNAAHAAEVEKPN